MSDITEKKRRYYSGVIADIASIPASGLGVGDNYFATDTKVLYFWDSVAWIIIPLDVIVAGMIQTDAVETLKIKDLNVTIAKAEIGFGRYVDRRVNTEDKGTADFTKDGNWHVDGLDLSGIVPVGAVAIIMTWSFVCNAANKPGEIRVNATNVFNRTKQHTQVADIPIYTPPTAVSCDSNRLLDYNFDAATTGISLAVLGWFI